MLLSLNENDPSSFITFPVDAKDHAWGINIKKCSIILMHLIFIVTLEMRQIQV